MALVLIKQPLRISLIDSQRGDSLLGEVRMATFYVLFSVTACINIELNITGENGSYKITKK